MNTENDQYDLKCPSRSGKYGFETFEQEKDGLFYFHFNDEQGKALLFSQGYTTDRGRDKGVQSVMRNAGNESRYERNTSAKGRFYFLLKSGNHQEIARSRDFPSEAEMEKFLKMTKKIKRNTPVHPVEGKVEPPVEKPGKAIVPIAPEKTESEPVEKMPRYKFSIIYYPDSEIWSVVHDLTGTSRRFKELKGEAIREFMESFLTAEKKETVMVKAERAPAPKMAAPPKESEIPLVIRSAQGKPTSGFIHTNVTYPYVVESEVKIDGELAPPEVEVDVSARPFSGKEPVRLIHEKKRLTQEGKLFLPVIFSRLEPGMYRILLTVKTGDSGKEEKEFHASRTVMVEK